MGKKRRVFIIGAGMSKECGAPLVNEFLSTRFTKNVYRKRLNSVKEFIQSVYPVIATPNIEEVLSLIDHTLARKEKIGKYDTVELQLMRRRVINVIVDILTSVQDDFEKDFGVDSRLVNPYAALINDKLRKEEIFPEVITPEFIENIPKDLSDIIIMATDTHINSFGPIAENYRNTYLTLAESVCSKETEDTIISLNYDLFLDYALTSVEDRWSLIGLEPEVGVCCDFGINYLKLNTYLDVPCNSALSCIDRPHYVGENKLITVLKLHGSLNWGYCTYCKKLITTILTPLIKVQPYIQEMKEMEFEIRRRYFCCSEFDIEPLIVPPTWMKDYNNRHLESIWILANRHLSIADEIIFLGYSFSESDYQIRYLFNKAFSIRNKKLWKILVVDKNIKKVLPIYKRFFGEVNFFCGKVSDYLKSITDKTK